MPGPGAVIYDQRVTGRALLTNGRAPSGDPKSVGSAVFISLLIQKKGSRVRVGVGRWTAPLPATLQRARRTIADGTVFERGGGECPSHLYPLLNAKRRPPPRYGQDSCGSASPTPLQMRIRLEVGIYMHNIHIRNICIRIRIYILYEYTYKYMCMCIYSCVCVRVYACRTPLFALCTRAFHRLNRIM